MKKTRRFFLAIIMALAVLALLVFGYRGFIKSGERSLESAFSKDAAMVFVIDYTSDEQAANLEKMVNQFPATGVDGIVKNYFDGLIQQSGLSWNQDLAAIFKGKWKVGFSMALPAGADATEAAKAELVFAGKFSENKQIPILLNKLMTGGTDFWKNVKYEKNKDVEYWTDEFNGIFFALTGDIFVATKNDADRKVVMKRMNNDDGLDIKAKDRLMYAYIGEKFFNSGDSILSKILQSMKGAFAEIIIAQDGIRSFYKANVDTKGEGFNILVPNPDYKLALVDKVNSKGLFFYTESSSFMNVLMADFVDGEAVVPVAINSADSLKSYIGSFIKKVKFLLDSPHAISISDKDNYVPAIALYFQLKDEDLDKAKSLLVDFDGYVDQVIMEVNKIIPAIKGQPSPFKKDIAVVNGGALHKVYMDWAAVPQNLITEWSTKSEINVTSVKNEFYYGLMGDNVFVVAWYPDFPDAYGKDVVSQNVDYQEAFKQISGGFNRSVFYMDTKSLLGFADKFMKMAVTMNTEEGMAKDIALGYVKLAEKFIGTVKYYIATSGYKEGQLSSESFMKTEKVEDDEIEKK